MWASNLGIVLLCLAVWCVGFLVILIVQIWGMLRAYLAEKKRQKKQSTV